MVVVFLNFGFFFRSSLGSGGVFAGVKRGLLCRIGIEGMWEMIRWLEIYGFGFLDFRK